MLLAHVAVPVVAATCIAVTLAASAAPIASADQEADEATSGEAERSATTSKPHPVAPHAQTTGATTNSIDLLLKMEPQPSETPQDPSTSRARFATRPAFIASAAWESAQPDGRDAKDPGVQSQIAKTLFSERDAARVEGVRATQQGHDPLGRPPTEGAQESGGFGVRPVAAGGTGTTRRLLDFPFFRFIRDHREMVIGSGLAALAAMWATASFRTRRRR